MIGGRRPEIIKSRTGLHEVARTIRVDSMLRPCATFPIPPQGGHLFGFRRVREERRSGGDEQPGTPTGRITFLRQFVKQARMQEVSRLPDIAG